METTYALVNLLGAVPGLLLAVVIWRGGRRHPPNRILAAGLVAYSCLLLTHFMARFGFVNSPKHDLVLTNTFLYISWPAFFLYLRALTSAANLPKRNELIHGVPLLSYIALFDAPTLLGFEPFAPVYLASMAYTGIVMVGYSIGMLATLFSYRRSIENFFSETTLLRLTWIRTNIVLWLVVVFIQIVFTGLQSADVRIPEPALVVHGLMISLITTAWVYVLGYYAIVHPSILQLTHQMAEELQQPLPATAPDPEEKAEQEKTEPKVESQTGSREQDDDSERENDRAVLERLYGLMEKEKPYLDDQLTIAKLADRLGVPAYALGRIINRSLNKNFITFINEHRVEEVKQRLLDESNGDLRIIDIAFDCGFRTKSAFNAAFKKTTGSTPSQFREKFKQT